MLGLNAAVRYYYIMIIIIAAIRVAVILFFIRNEFDYKRQIMCRTVVIHISYWRVRLNNSKTLMAPIEMNVSAADRGFDFY